MSRKIIKIDPIIKERLPFTGLGCLQATVDVNPISYVWAELRMELADLIEGAERTIISEIPTIEATRKAYKILGKDPSRYRPSAEALIRRLASGKEVPEVNTVVDCLNYVSIVTGFSIGGYDTNSIGEEITLCIGKADEEYKGIGRQGLFNIEHLPVLRDEQGAFGCPTSDSIRSAILESTQQCLWVLFDFGESDNLHRALDFAAHVLHQRGDGTDIDTWIV